MNAYKRRHKMLGYLFDFYKQKCNSTTSREFPPEDYRIPIASFNIEMDISNYKDDVILDPLFHNNEIILSNDGQTTYYHVTKAGRSAYLNKKYLKELNQYRQEWPKRNWILVAVFTYLLGIFTPTIQKSIDKLIPKKSINKTNTNSIIDSTKYKK